MDPPQQWLQACTARPWWLGSQCDRGLDAQNGLGVVASGALAGFLYLQRREQAAAQAAADAQLADQRASLGALRSQARTCALELQCASPHAVAYCSGYALVFLSVRTQHWVVCAPVCLMKMCRKSLAGGGGDERGRARAGAGCQAA